jgi:hypothetical protein
MSISLLTFVGNLADELRLDAPTTVVGNTNRNVKTMVRAIYNVADDMLDKAEWPETRRTHSFDLVASTAAYAFPTDFNRMVFNTEWDEDEQWPIVPMTSEEYQQFRCAMAAEPIHRRYMARGSGSAQFFLYPTPDTSDAGKTMSFEYVSDTWILPKTWVTGTVYAAASYVSYDGNIYLTSAGGTAGATAPTHTTGSASDGTVTWTYCTYHWPTFVADTDLILLPEDVLRLGARYYWRFLVGMGYADFKKEYEDAILQATTRKQSARTLSLGSRRYAHFMNYWNIPDHGYG